MPVAPRPPERYTSAGTSIPIDVFLPATPGATPGRAVLIVHGSSGLSPAYRPDMVSFADALAAKGIITMMPHYFVSTGMKAEDDGLPVLTRHGAAWMQACSDALAFMSHDSRCDPARLGLLGFSFGAHVALRLGMDPPAAVRPRAVVDFFGPTITAPLDGSWARMPALQIHHGKADKVVKPVETEHLIGKLEAAGKRKDKDYTITWYDGQGHGFDATALPGARAATVTFFESTL